MGQDQDKDFNIKPGVAIGYSLACALGGDRQMTVQCFVDEAEDLEVVNARMDRVFAVMDRQKAKYDLAKEIKEFEEVALHTRNFLNAIPMADQAAKAQMETLKAELLGMQEARKEVFDAAYEQHVAGKRQGAFVPTGALKGRLQNMDNEIAKKEAAIRAVPADTAQHREQTLVNLKKYQDDLRKRRDHINDLRKQAGLDEYTDFLQEQNTIWVDTTKGK